MLENIKIPESNELQMRQLAGSALQNLSDASEAAWRGICESDPLADSMAALQEMADDAWASCAPALEAAGDAVVDSAKNGAYLAGRTALGAGSFVEGAVETGFVWAESAMGNREAAEAELDTQFCDELADRMGEALAVDDGIRELGDKAAGLGEAGAAAASAVGATLLIANPAVAPAVGAIATGAASMGVAGEVLHSEYEAEGELTDEALAKSGIAAVATAATIAVPGATARSANVAAAETAIAKEGAESAVGEMAARKDGAEYVICRNESLAGDVHPITGVPFNEKCIVQESGRTIEGVFPEFESVFDAKIPKELYEASNTAQFKVCNQQLLENPDALARLTDEQVLQVMEGAIDGSVPDGFVWHHNEAEGVIQLVDRATHELTGHTGGRSIWGGGY